jgi:endonuclease YncB( thermonuclease family)
MDHFDRALFLLAVLFLAGVLTLVCLAVFAVLKSLWRLFAGAGKDSSPAETGAPAVEAPAPQPAPLDAPAIRAKTKALSEAEAKLAIETFLSARVAEVVDGDTVDVEIGRDRVRIRLDSIDCPEDGQAWGDIATYGLIKIIGGQTVRLEIYGRDDFGRTLATFYVRHQQTGAWLNANERMVMLGHAWVMHRYYDHLPPGRQNKLNRLEDWARAKKVGLWRDPNPLPPWLWRRRDRGADESLNGA